MSSSSQYESLPGLPYRKATQILVFENIGHVFIQQTGKYGVVPHEAQETWQIVLHSDYLDDVITQLQYAKLQIEQAKGGIGK